MQIIKQTRGSTHIQFTPEEVSELGLKLKADRVQQWRGFYFHGLRYLMGRGIPLDRVVRRVLRGERGFRLIVYANNRILRRERKEAA